MGQDISAYKDQLLTFIHNGADHKHLNGETSNLQFLQKVQLIEGKNLFSVGNGHISTTLRRAKRGTYTTDDVEGLEANASYHLVMEQMKGALEGKKEENNAAKNEKEKREHHRTSTGVPFLCSKSLTADDLNRFQEENDGFPLPSSAKELEEFDNVFFASDAVLTSSPKPKRRSKSVPFISLTRSKKDEYCIQAPVKQKFLDRLFAGRSKSKANNSSPKNGIVKKSSKAEKLKSLGDSSDSRDTKLNGNDNGSPNSDHACPDTGQSDSDENTTIKAGGIYSLEKLRCLDSTGSTYLSLQGIVKQRRLQFQKCVDEGTNVNVESGDDSESRSLPSSPQCRAKGLPASVDRHLSHQYSPLMQIRGNCYKFVHDESFSTSVMSMGYVRALATKLNSDAQIQEKPIPEKGKLDDDVFTNNNKHILSSSPKSSSSPTSNSPVSRRRKSSETGSPWIVRSSVKGKDKKSVSEQIRYIESRNSRSVNFRSRNGSRSNPAHHSPRPKRQSEIEDLFDSSWSDESDQDQSFESEDSDLDAKRDLRQKQATPAEQSYQIANELLTTERTYVSRLHLLDQVFHFKIVLENQAHNFMPPEVITQMFSNIKSLYKFHSEFMLPELETTMEKWKSKKRIGDLMKQKAPFLKMYSEYMKNFDNAMNLINQWSEKSAKFLSLLQDIQMMPECGSLTLQHHMLGPIQRVPRYELLLRDYLKKLPEDSPDREDTEVALKLVTTAATHTEESMKQIEKFRKLLDINETLGGGLDLINPSRELVREGLISKVRARNGEKQERYILLFNDMLMICSEHLLGTYRVHAQIDMDGMEILTEEDLDIPSKFIVKNGEKKVLFCNFTPQGENTGWHEAIKKVVVEFKEKKKSLRVVADEDVLSSVLTGPNVGKIPPSFIKDDAALNCMKCALVFTAFRRRHHCKACGRVICAKCSTKRTALSYDDSRINRVCDICYSFLTNKDGDTSPGCDMRKRGLLQVKASEPSVISGYLQVSSDNGRSWSKKWIAVHKDFAMFFFKTHQDASALSSLPLPGYSVVMVEDDKFDRQNVFKILHQKTIYFFQAGNPDQMKKWMKALMKIVALEVPEEVVRFDGDNSSMSSANS